MFRLPLSSGRVIQFMIAGFICCGGVCESAEELQVRADGQPLVATADGGYEAAAGALVEIDASRYEKGSFRWLLANSSRYFLQVEENRKVVFTTAASENYIFVFSYVKPQAATAPPEHDLKKVVIRTIGSAPAPLVPVASCANRPAGRFGLAKKTCEGVSRVTGSTPDQRLKDQAVKAKDSILKLRLDLVGGSVRVADVKTLLPLRIKTALGADAVPWDAFGVLLQDEVKQLEAASRLANDSDYKSALDEIIQGF